MLESFSFDSFLNAIEQGELLVDFDARTGHNHGTKFRIRSGLISHLYEHASDIS